jgi:hypothetical protein
MEIYFVAFKETGLFEAWKKWAKTIEEKANEKNIKIITKEVSILDLKVDAIVSPANSIINT